MPLGSILSLQSCLHRKFDWPLVTKGLSLAQNGDKGKRRDCHAFVRSDVSPRLPASAMPATTAVV